MAKKGSTIKRKLSKGKSWYKILAPRAFNLVEIGEALSSNSENLKQRIIDIQYSAISGEVTKHYIKAKLRVTKVEGENAHTEFIGYEISKPYLQRIIRRRSSKIDEVIDLKLKDQNVRLKTITITLRRANALQRTALRKAIKTEILKNMTNYTFEELAKTLAYGKLQRAIKEKIKIIYPVKFFDVRKIELLPERKIKKDLGQEKIEEVEKKEAKKTGKKIEAIEPAKTEEPEIILKETPVEEKTEATPEVETTEA